MYPVTKPLFLGSAHFAPNRPRTDAPTAAPGTPSMPGSAEGAGIDCRGGGDGGASSAPAVTDEVAGTGGGGGDTCAGGGAPTSGTAIPLLPWPSAHGVPTGIGWIPVTPA